MATPRSKRTLDDFRRDDGTLGQIVDRIQHAPMDEPSEGVKLGRRFLGAMMGLNLPPPLDEIQPTVVVDRARFERLQAVVNALDENWGSVRHYAMRYIAYEEIKDIDVIEDTLKALQPGDRDPLP